MSLWYEEVGIKYTIEEIENEIRWDFTWDSQFSDYSVRNLPYINKGHVEAPIIVSIDGPIKKPKISLYADNKLTQEVEINIEIGEDEKLLYGTKDNDFYINKQDKEGTLTSLFSLEYINFEKDNVIRIPVYKSCELRLSAESGEILSAEVTILPGYKSV